MFSNMDEQQKDAMYAYGKHLGLAFQVGGLALWLWVLLTRVWGCCRTGVLPGACGALRYLKSLEHLSEGDMPCRAATC